MGRSGSGGGGRSGGGHSGGGRSGGSRSSGRSAMGSGGRSGMSGSSRPSGGMGGSSRPSGGFGGGPRPRGGFHPNPRPIGGFGPAPMPGGGFGPEPRHRRPRRGGGCLTTIGTMICWMIVIVMLFSFVGGRSRSNGGHQVSYTAGYSDNVEEWTLTLSTRKREKLNLNVSDKAGYVTDECHWIQNRTTFEKGLKSFYEDTGILPYVYIIDNVAGDYDPSTEKLEQFAEEQYEALFDDEGHILLVFWDYGGAYEYTLWLGADTVDFMDTEACDILFDYLDYYYYQADTEDAFFAESFEKAGKRMTSVTHSSIYYVVIVVVAGAVVFGVYKVIKTKKDKQAERKKKAEEILNTPLDKFGSDGEDIDALAKKYEKEL